MYLCLLQLLVATPGPGNATNRRAQCLGFFKTWLGDGQTLSGVCLLYCWTPGFSILQGLHKQIPNQSVTHSRKRLLVTDMRSLCIESTNTSTTFALDRHFFANGGEKNFMQDQMGWMIQSGTLVRLFFWGGSFFEFGWSFSMQPLLSRNSWVQKNDRSFELELVPCECHIRATENHEFGEPKR